MVWKEGASEPTAKMAEQTRAGELRERLMQEGEKAAHEAVEFEHDEDDDWGEEWACTHCGGEGTCCDGADPLGNCPDEYHRCHACGGSGRRKDQTLF